MSWIFYEPEIDENGTDTGKRKVTLIYNDEPPQDVIDAFKQRGGGYFEGTKPKKTKAPGKQKLPYANPDTKEVYYEERDLPDDHPEMQALRLKRIETALEADDTSTGTIAQRLKDIETRLKNIEEKSDSATKA